MFRWLHIPDGDRRWRYSAIFALLTYEPIIHDNLMKRLYTSLLTGAALLAAGAVSAQSAGRDKAAQVDRSALVNPSARPALNAGQEFRGTAPPNDLCGSVSVDALAAGGTLTYNGTTTGATNTGDAVAGSNLDLGGDTAFVFHAFTTTGCTDIAVAYCGTATQPAVYQAVLSVDCPLDANLINFSAGNFSDCADGNATIFWTAVPAGTYYLPIRSEPATAGPYTVTVSATACAVAPGNDDCAGAYSLPVGTWCNMATYGSDGATESAPADSCNGYLGDAGDDVWFSFVATSSNMAIGVQGSDDGDGNVNTGYDAVVQLFSGACPGTLISCADATFNSEAEEILATGLTIGSTYLIRTYDYYAAEPSLASFGICVVDGTGINIGVDENTTGAEWTIYPNPGTGVFNLQYNGANTSISIEVIDITGRVVYTEQTSMATGTSHAIDLSGVAAGNYNVRLTANGVRTEQRLAVK